MHVNPELFHEETRQLLITNFLEKNTQLNLSAIRTPQEVFTKHILDSIEILNTTNLLWPSHPLNNATTWLDVWTWWWFPLLPLAHALPHIQRTWIDARRKKTEAVAQIAQASALHNVHLTWWRIEDHAHRYNLITARAVGISDWLIPLLYPRLTKWGWIVLYKMVTTQEDTMIEAMMQESSWKRKLKLVTKHHYTLPWSLTPRALYFFHDIALQKR
jgi:16S rRNA (guanine527-N7)-methyltransferase